MPSTVESANGIGPIVRAELLAEAGRVIATSLDPRVMLGSLASVVVPAIADQCHVDLRSEDGSFRRVSIAHVDPALEPLLRKFDLRPDQFTANHPTRRVVEDGRAALMTGITPDQLPRVFGRFWQGGLRDRLGIGLGLAISKGIVEAHGGEIRVESTLGEGTTFSFTPPSAAE
jgi:hypothetical protein